MRRTPRLPGALPALPMAESRALGVTAAAGLLLNLLAGVERGSAWKRSRLSAFKANWSHCSVVRHTTGAKDTKETAIPMMKCGVDERVTFVSNFARLSWMCFTKGPSTSSGRSFSRQNSTAASCAATFSLGCTRTQRNEFSAEGLKQQSQSLLQHSSSK